MKCAITLKLPKTISAKTADRDNPPWSEETLGPATLRRGRGRHKAPTKVLTTIGLDADVSAVFRAQGSGYQSRINAALPNKLPAQILDFTQAATPDFWIEQVRNPQNMSARCGR